MGLGTERALVDRGLLHARNPDEAAVFDKGIYAAAEWARPAHPAECRYDILTILSGNAPGVIQI
jgi:hypothetical protein